MRSDGGQVTPPELIRMVSIDPGEVHVGMCVWIGATIQSVYETSPAGCRLSVKHWLLADAIDELVVEEFRLFPDKARAQSFKENRTAELIGVLRAAAEDHGRVLWVQQPASIQKPTAGHCRAKGITLEAVRLGRGPHAKSAELHGRYRLMHGRPGIDSRSAPG